MGKFHFVIAFCKVNKKLQNLILCKAAISNAKTQYWKTHIFQWALIKICYLTFVFFEKYITGENIRTICLCSFDDFWFFTKFFDFHVIFWNFSWVFTQNFTIFYFFICAWLFVFFIALFIFFFFFIKLCEIFENLWAGNK